MAEELDLEVSSASPENLTGGATETLQETQAAQELQKLQLRNVADLLEAMQKAFEYQTSKLYEVIEEIAKLTKALGEVYDTHLLEMRREIQWFQAVQGEFRILDMPEGQSSLEAEVKVPEK